MDSYQEFKIHQCNENLAVVDQWLLFGGAVIEFHSNSNNLIIMIIMIIIQQQWMNRQCRDNAE